MNPAKCDELDYIDFLVASQRSFSCTEASRCQPRLENKTDQNTTAAHDAFNRLLLRLPQNTEALWEESKNLIDKQGGFLIVDDSTLDKPYSEKIDLVTYHWSGKHHRVVKGINLITLLWSDGQAHIPVDFRIYKADGKTKNDHFHDMLKTAHNRGFKPKYVLFDSWYSSLENLKLLRSFGYSFFCGLKENRLVNPTQGREGEVNLCRVEVADFGLVVYLKGFGLIKVFRKVSKDGDVSYYGCDVLKAGADEYGMLAGLGWRIEQYHRGIKQCCGVEKAFVRKAHAVVNHIGMAIRAFAL